MCPPDDIPFEPSGSQTESSGTSKPGTSKPGGSRREIGAESEVRGGPEAPDDALDETDGGAEKPKP
jgi:hypothetical protein